MIAPGRGPAPGVAKPPPLIGDRYALVRAIGRGASATVYEAHDRALDRRVAVKRLHPHLAGTDAARALRAQGTLLARYPHRHLVGCLDAGEDGGSSYLVLELIEGPDLAALAGAGGVARIEDGVRWAAQLCDVLAHLHRRDLVHGDLKPQHAIFAAGDRLVLIDPGAPVHARDGSIIGTAAYLAPEVRAGTRPSPESDCYALGVVLFRLLTGRLPFDGDDDIALARRHAEDIAPLLRRHRPEAAASLERLVAQLLAKRPAERPSAAEALRYLVHD